MSENWSRSYWILCASSPWRTIVLTFSQPVERKFLVLDKRLHIEYMYYLQKLCMFSVRYSIATAFMGWGKQYDLKLVSISLISACTYPWTVNCADLFLKSYNINWQSMGMTWMPTYWI